MGTFGEKLKQARESRGISLREVADTTKIQRRYLEALESDDFDSLPGQAFGKFYIRAFADVLEIDPGALLEVYDRERMERDRSETRFEEKPKRRRRFGFIFGGDPEPVEDQPPRPTRSEIGEVVATPRTSTSGTESRGRATSRSSSVGTPVLNKTGETPSPASTGRTEGTISRSGVGATVGDPVVVRRPEEERYEAKRAEARRREAEKLEAEKLEAEKLEAEKREAERIETERVAAERKQAKRRKAERIEAERVAAEREQAKHREAERIEAERVEAEREQAKLREAERIEAERVAAERKQAKRREAERVEAERVAAERKQAKRREAERVEAERVEAERKQAKRREAERVEAERIDAERVAAERKQAKLREAERIEAEKREAERIEAERVAAERKQAKLRKAERIEAERCEAERIEAERVAAERIEAERVAAERKQAKLRKAERVAAERKQAKLRKAERVEAERAAAEPTEDDIAAVAASVAAADTPAAPKGPGFLVRVALPRSGSMRTIAMVAGGVALIATVLLFTLNREDGLSADPVETTATEPGTTGREDPDPVESTVEAVDSGSSPVAISDPIEASEAALSTENQVPAAATPTPVSAPPPPVADGALEIVEFGVGRAVVSRRLVDPGSRFEEGSSVSFATRVTGGVAGQTIRHVWLRDGRVVQGITLKLGGDHWRTHSKKTLWGVGPWAIEARDGEGRVLARSEFECVPKGS